MHILETNENISCEFPEQIYCVLEKRKIDFNFCRQIQLRWTQFGPKDSGVLICNTALGFVFFQIFRIFMQPAVTVMVCDHTWAMKMERTTINIIIRGHTMSGCQCLVGQFYNKWAPGCS